jgi:murein DD-endopeptidase MepM/ murein hydrolase activator NlpD
VVINNVFAKVRATAGTVAAASAVFVANPALANSSANADIAAPLRAAQAAKPATGGTEEQFRQLFSSWQAIEKQRAPLAAISEAANLAASSSASPIASLGIKPFGRSTVSIPSRIPVEGVRLTSDYGMRFHPVVGGRRMHKGVDLAAPVGTPIHATADGVVSRADWFSSYGLYVSIEHGGNLETRYGHMSRLNVAAGQEVHKGDIIGFVGTTGRSTGPHLHYEVRIAGNAVNPIPYMQADAYH